MGDSVEIPKISQLDSMLNDLSGRSGALISLLNELTDQLGGLLNADSAPEKAVEVSQQQSEVAKRIYGIDDDIKWSITKVNSLKERLIV